MFQNPRAKVITLGLCLGIAIAVAGCSSREERAQAFYDRGMSYLENKDYAKARIEFRNAIQRKADLLPAWQALATIEEHEQNIPALVSILRRVIELSPNDIAATSKLVRIYLQGGPNSLDQALQLANKASEIDPKDPNVLALKAAALYKLKDNEGAASTAQQALKIDPHNTAASVVLGGVKLSKGDADGALQALAPLSKEGLDDLGVVFLKLNIFSQKGDLPQVEGLLRKLTELYPNAPQFRSQLVRFYLQNNRQDDAINQLRTAAAANPNDINAELELVNVLATVKGPAAGRSELVERIKDGKNAFQYQIALARFDLAQGKADDSIKLLQQLIASPVPGDEVLIAKNALANIYMGQNKVAAAEPLVTEILRTDARNINGLRLRAAIHLDRGQIDEAIADLRSALNDQPRSVELLLALATAYERGGSIELAGKTAFDAMKASGYSPAVGLSYAAFLQRRSEPAQVESTLNDLAGRNPNSIPVLSALARVRLQRQDWVGAHAIADAIARLGAKSDIADEINAAAFSGQGKFADSLAILQNSYRAHPGAVRPMVDLVNAYVRSGQTVQAETFLRSALADNPANAEALVLMGSVQIVKNAPGEAEKYFKTAIEKKANDPVGYRALANLYSRQDKANDALTVVRAGLKQEPTDFGLRLSLAGLLETKGEYEPAIAEYESMLKDQPGLLVVANNLASLLADRRTDKASLDRAASLAAMLKNVDTPQFKDTLGWVNYRRQDYRAAIPLLEAAVQALPNSALVHYHLGMGYLGTGQDDKASEEFKKVRTLAPKDTELGAKIDDALKNRPPKAKG